MAPLPPPSIEDAEKGWRIAPDYLDRIAKAAGEDWPRPDWETVQAVLLAHTEAVSQTEVSRCQS